MKRYHVNAGLQKILSSLLWILLGVNILTVNLFAQRYSGVWQESEKKERILADATWNTFEETNKKLIAKKFRLVDTEVFITGGQRKYSAVWHSGKDSSAVFADNWLLFREKIDLYKEKEMKLVDIETYMEGNERKFFGVWRSGTETQKIEIGLPWPEFYRLWEQYGDEDLRLMDIEIYEEDRERKYAGFWEVGAQEHRLWRDLDWKTFKTIWQGLKEQHFHLVDFETYIINNERKFLGAWLKIDKNDHRIVIDKTWNEFIQEWLENGRDNVWLIDLEIY
jgi:hypothetical protein